MSGNGASPSRAARRDLPAAIADQRRARMVAGLRGLAGVGTGGGGAGPSDAIAAVAAATAADERCDLCASTVPEDHRHLLNLVDRQIVCVCESCWAIRSGDPDLRPTGSRTVWLEGFALPDELWASFGIPIGLAFLFHSSVTDCVVALYPSPAGATESELRFESWSELQTLNPVLDSLEPDGEALVVNRMTDPPAAAIAPIDRCYGLVGLVKATWQGISGGAEVEQAVTRWFEELRAAAVSA